MQKEHNRLFTTRFESSLDDCHGSCCLRDPAIGEIVADAFHHFDGERYDLGSFVDMPNHVHVLFRANHGYRLEDILHTWKRFTSREINKSLERTGQLWQTEYWDRLIRSQKHLDWALRYIDENPAKLPSGSFLLWRRGLQTLSEKSSISPAQS